MRISDWSSDVCSSDLQVAFGAMHRMGNALGQGDFGQVHVGATDQLSQVHFNELGQVGGQAGYFQFGQDMADDLATDRSEERRVGKACVSTCRSRWSRYH